MARNVTLIFDLDLDDMTLTSYTVTQLQAFMTLSFEKKNGHFLRNLTLIFDLDLDDMTLTGWVLSKATCTSNMSILT